MSDLRSDPRKVRIIKKYMNYMFVGRTQVYFDETVGRKISPTIAAFAVFAVFTFKNGIKHRKEMEQRI